jgi:hypothetical protein
MLHLLPGCMSLLMLCWHAGTLAVVRAGTAQPMHSSEHDTGS